MPSQIEEPFQIHHLERAYSSNWELQGFIHTMKTHEMHE